MAANRFALSNTAKTTLTTRASLGAQPDQTTGGSQVITSGGGGGGGVTSITAGRRMTGGVITTSGTIGLNTFLEYNVRDYGAAGNGSTDDTAAIQSAITAAQGTGGCVQFPSGIYLISSALSCSITGGKNISFVGQSWATTYLLQSGANANGLVIDLSAGVLAPPGCYCEVTGLTFTTAHSIITGTALICTYGSTNLSNNGAYPGPWIHHISVGENPNTDTGGWVNAINLTNCWQAKVENVYLYGNSNSYASGSGPASGAAIAMLSGVNNTISDVQGAFWFQGIKLAPVSNSAGQNQIAQGIMMSDINFVECIEGAHFYTNATNDAYDFISMVNVQFDLGNLSNVNHKCIIVESSVNFYLSNALLLQNNGGAILTLNDSGTVFISAVAFQSATNNPSSALAITGSSNFGQVIGCNFNNLPIGIGASCGWWTINNTFGSTTTDLGTSNKIGDAKQFTAVITPTATATYTFSVNIALAGLAVKPQAAPADIIDAVSLPTDYRCTYAYGNGGNNATTAFFTLFRTGGTSLVASPLRVGITINP